MQTSTNTDLARASTMLVAASVVWLLHASMLAGWILFSEDLPAYFFQAAFEANGIWSRQQDPLTHAQKDQ
ncbi:hypothetical protein ACHAPD_004518 [Fusarium lateritium]